MNPLDLKNILEGTPPQKLSTAYKVGMIIGLLIMVGLFLLLLMICWNHVMPLFGVPKLDFSQTAALYFMIFILFRGKLKK